MPSKKNTLAIKKAACHEKMYCDLLNTIDGIKMEDILKFDFPALNDRDEIGKKVKPNVDLLCFALFVLLTVFLQ